MQPWRFNRTIPPGPNPNQRSLERQHAPPERQQPNNTRYTFQQFFGHAPPFKPHHIRLFERLEREWELKYLPLSVFDKGGLRLYVWSQALPNPAIHFEESAKRLPIIRKGQDFKEFFLVHCRAQHNPSVSTRTGRCPLCSSQLLGFKICDHDRNICPLNPLQLYDRLEWVGINFLAYCPACHSRSAKHPKDKCDKARKTCEICKKYGHSPIQRMCNTEIGRNPSQQLAEVNGFRRAHLQRIRALMKDEKTRLRYELRSDYTYVPDVSNRTPEGKRCGYHVLCEGQHEFAQLHLTRYSNFGTGIKAFYPSLVPPELDSSVQLNIPTFDPMTEEYLELFATKLTEYRQHGNYEEVEWPPYPLPAPEDTIDPEDLTYRSVPMGHFDPEDSMMEVYNNIPRPVIPPPPGPPTRLRRTPSPQTRRFFIEHIRGYVPSRSPSRSPSPPPLTKEELEELPPTALNNYESHKDFVAIMERHSQGARDIRNQQPAQSSSQSATPYRYATSRETFREHMARNKSSRYAERHQAALSPSSDSDEPVDEPKEQQSAMSHQVVDQTDELRAALEERIFDEEAIMHCHEVARVNGKPARPGPQKLAYDAITRHRSTPTSRLALIERVKTLQFILTGARDPDHATYDNASQRDLSQYTNDLNKCCMRISLEPLIYVQLELDDPQKVHAKPTTGSDIFYVPGLQLWQHPNVRQSMNDVCGGQKVFDKFVNPAFTWFYPPIYHPLSIEEEEEHQNLFLGVQRPFGQNPYYFFADDIQRCLDLPIPTNINVLTIRIQWTIHYLTGMDYPEPLSEKRQNLMDYLNLIRSAMTLLRELSDKHHTVNFKVTPCIVTIATEAARGHNFALPTSKLFDSHSLNRWIVFFNLAWRQLREVTVKDTRHREGCDCGNPENVLMGQALPAPLDHPE